MYSRYQRAGKLRPVIRTTSSVLPASRRRARSCLRRNQPAANRWSPGQRRRDPIRLPLHHLAAGPGRRGDEDDRRDPVARRREPDRVRGADGVADCGEATGVDLGTVAEPVEGEGGVARLGVEARQEEVPVRPSHAALVVAERADARLGESRGERVRHVETLTAHVRVAVEGARPAQDERRRGRWLSRGRREGAGQPGAVLPSEVDLLDGCSRHGARPRP
jgi:hypothetical protein